MGVCVRAVVSGFAWFGIWREVDDLWRWSRLWFHARARACLCLCVCVVAPCGRHYYAFVYARACVYRANFEFLAKYLIHSLDSGDFSVSAKIKLTQKNQIIMAFGSKFLKKCTQI